MNLEEGWVLSQCTCRTQHSVSNACCRHNLTAFQSNVSNSPKEGVLEVKKITGLGACLVDLSNNTNVIALSVRGSGNK